MNLVPLLHRVLVKPEKLEEFSEDYKRAAAIGLTIPELESAKRAQANVDQGVVVAIGETAYKDYGIDPPIKVGDVVNWAKYGGKLLEDYATKEFYVVLNDEDIICVVKEKMNE